jgi:hypothetical protein
MRKRSIANLLSRNCRRGRDKKWRLPGRPQLRQVHQFRKERRRLSLTPSFQFFNQTLEHAGGCTIRWQHQWPRARCVLRAVRSDDKSCAEFWEEFSEAAVAADSLAGHVATIGRTQESPGACEPGDLNVAWTISTARQPDLLLLSLRPWPPSLARRLPTSCM